jgi:hypothetical protein
LISHTKIAIAKFMLNEDRKQSITSSSKMIHICLPHFSELFGIYRLPFTTDCSFLSNYLDMIVHAKNGLVSINFRTFSKANINQICKRRINGPFE